MPQPDIIRRMASVRILVVGDIILDVYTIAEAIRVSPEAPVPILLNPKQEYRPGGAAAVAAMCAALGADTALIGVTGDDRHGQRLSNILDALKVAHYPIADSSRPTTVKERICGIASGKHRQQLARIDSESTMPIGPDLSRSISEMIRGVDFVDLILIADYAKGLMTPAVVKACLDTGIPCIVDPPRNCDWSKYCGAACLVPNRQEANGSTPLDLVTEYRLQAAVVKLDQDGCRLQDDVVPMTRAIHAQARAVHDVTGAGDQFLAVLGCARAAGATWLHAAELANAAAGLQVERHGCVPVTLFEIAHEVSQWQSVP